MGVVDWSTNPVQNDVQGQINWAEGMHPNRVNDSARQMMADIAVWRDTLVTKAGNLSGLSDTAVARTNIGLGNVNNTSDADKPISTAQQTAFNERYTKTEADGRFAQIGAEQTISAHWQFADAVEIRLGNDSDLKLMHSGSAGFVTNQTGAMYCRQHALAQHVHFETKDVHGTLYYPLSLMSGYYAILRYGADEKLSTQGWGVKVFGDLRVRVGSNEYSAFHGGNVHDNFDLTAGTFGGKAPTELSSAAPDAVLSHETAVGVGGGTATSGSWQTRPLNSEDDPSGIVTLANNEIAVTANCWADGWSHAYFCNTHQARIYCVTDNAAVAMGSTERSRVGDGISTRSVFCGRLEAGKTYRIEHRVQTTQATKGWGRNNEFGEPNLFAQVKLWRLS